MRKTIKRENGTGSVYFRKDKKNRPWVAVAPAVKKNGLYKQMIIGSYATAKEAKDALYQFNKSPTEKFNITVAETFDEWSRIAYRNISAATQANYDAAYKKMQPLYDLKLRDLRTAQMQEIIDDNADMSRSSLSKIKILFKQLLDYGVENDVLLKNYAQFLVLPKEEKKAKDCFTDLELKKIEDAAGEKVPFADLILIMCYTGFRISEFLELTPFSYDHEKGTLTGGKKTEAGRNRIIPIHPKILSYVLLWLKKGGQTIFCKEDGTPYSVKHFRGKYYEALEEIGVRKLSPHATRHTFATRLSAAGAKAEDIQKIMGHSNFDVTANVYIHQDVETLKKAVNLIK